MIPKEEEIKQTEQDIKNRCSEKGLIVSKVSLDVRPYQMQDLSYDYNKKTKELKLTAYSVYYPMTLWDWIDEVISDLKNKN